jgi:hypothetical protein
MPAAKPINSRHFATWFTLFAALAGTLTSIVYMTYSLTEVPMHNGLPLIFYIVTTSLFVGLVNPSQNIISSDHSG